MVPLAASSGFVVIAVAVGFASLLLLYLFRVEDRAVAEDPEREAQGLGQAVDEPIAHSLAGGAAAAGRLAPARDRTPASPGPQPASAPPAPARPAPAFSPAPLTPEPRPPLPDPQGAAPEPTPVAPQPRPPLPDPQDIAPEAPPPAPEPAPRAPFPVARAPKPPPRVGEPLARTPVPAEAVLPEVPPPDTALPSANGPQAGTSHPAAGATPGPSAPAHEVPDPGERPDLSATSAGRLAGRGALAVRALIRRRRKRG